MTLPTRSDDNGVGVGFLFLSRSRSLCLTVSERVRPFSHHHHQHHQHTSFSPDGARFFCGPPEFFLFSRFSLLAAGVCSIVPAASTSGCGWREKQSGEGEFQCHLEGEKAQPSSDKRKKRSRRRRSQRSSARSFVLGWWLVEAVVVLLSVLCFQPVSVLCSGSSCSCRCSRCWHHSSHHLLLVVVLPSCVPACSAPPKCWTRSTDNGGKGKTVLLSAPPIGPSVCVFAVHCALSSDGGDDDDSDDRPAATSPQQQQHRRQSVCV